jgi:hypothetical protein
MEGYTWSNRCFPTSGGYTYRHTDWWDGFMKYAVERSVVAMIDIPSFIRIHLSIQKLMWRHTDTHRSLHVVSILSDSRLIIFLHIFINFVLKSLLWETEQINHINYFGALFQFLRIKICKWRWVNLAMFVGQLVEYWIKREGRKGTFDCIKLWLFSH